LGSGLFALACLSLAAAETTEIERNSNGSKPFNSDAAGSLRLPLQTGENFSYAAVSESSGGEESASELNRELTNPGELDLVSVEPVQQLLTQAGFGPKAVTTPKQQQQVSQLPPNVVSAVKYQGKLYYVYPTGKKDQIYVGKQAQYDAYKQALKAKILSQKAQQANYNAQQQEQMLYGDPAWSGETAGPHHIQVQVFQGFGPMELQGD